jgi:hypothetical protein
MGMVSLDGSPGLSPWVKDELPQSQKCVEALRGIQEELANELEGRFEVFDFGLPGGLGALEPDKQLIWLTRGCIWHAIALRAEFKLKLLHTVDGYLSAIDAKNPISTFLLARFMLELVATVSSIDFALEESIKIGLPQWKQRAIIFLVTLFRARYSSSDVKFKSAFADAGIPAELLQPIRIGKAIKELSSRHGFGSAVGLYGTFSNICHHNGSGHKMLSEGVRETNNIVTPRGKQLFIDRKQRAVTMGYPASDFTSHALAMTARPAWWSALSANKLLKELRASPFSDRELRTLTDGRITGVDAVYVETEILPGRSARRNGAKVGRNDVCPCGSGKKYKSCCWDKAG